MAWLIRLLLRHPRNLVGAHEIYLLANSIEAMAFRLERAMDQGDAAIIIRYQEREVFRINQTKRQVYMTGLSGYPELVYTFRCYRLGDWLMRLAMRNAIEFYDTNVHRVRMQDYRSFFGRKMEEVISDLAVQMTLAEKEARAVEGLDRADGGKRLHPDVQRMIQFEDPIPDQVPDAPEEL